MTFPDRSLFFPRRGRKTGLRACPHVSEAHLSLQRQRGFSQQVRNKKLHRVQCGYKERIKSLLSILQSPHAPYSVHTTVRPWVFRSFCTDLAWVSHTSTLSMPQRRETSFAMWYYCVSAVFWLFTGGKREN